MGWVVNIGSSVSIEAHAKFSYRRTPHYKDDHTADYVETVIEVEGRVVNEPASAVANDAAALDDDLIGDLSYKDVTIELDGSPWREHLAADALDGPRVEQFDLLPSKGGADSHWNYRIIIYVKDAADDEDDAFDLEASLAVFRNTKGKVIKKIWRASSGGKELSDAVAAVLALAPSGDVQFEDQSFFTPEIKYAATWIWEAGKSLDTPQNHEDPIRIEGLGKDYAVDPQAAGPEDLESPQPKLHEKMRGAALITVRGYVRGFVKDLVPFLPGPHYSEGPELVRAPAREAVFFPGLDPERGREGVYRLDYEEVWIYTGPQNTPPEPDHGDHLNDDAPAIAGGVAPGDGPMAELGS